MTYVQGFYGTPSTPSCGAFKAGSCNTIAAAVFFNNMCLGLNSCSQEGYGERRGEREDREVCIY